MSFFTSIGIFLTALLIQAFLQLNPSVFAIFYHSAIAKKSPKRADDSSLSFILGNEIFNAATFIIVFLIVSLITTFESSVNHIFLWIMAGIFLAESILMIFFYFKPGRASVTGTKLFISRSIARHLTYRAEHIKNRSDAIILGIITPSLELLFTLPLFIISSVAIIRATTTCAPYIILYILVATVPLFAIRTYFHMGYNLANLQRLRIKLKPHFKFILCLAYFLLALLTIYLGVINYGF